MAVIVPIASTADVFAQTAIVPVVSRVPCDLQSGKDTLLSKIPNAGDVIEIDDALAIIRPHHRYPYAVVVMLMRDGTIDAMLPDVTEDQVTLQRT